MTDSVRIKRFLKKGIQAKILSIDQMLMLSADDLMDVTELHGIDEAVIEKTLNQLKSKMIPSGIDRRLKTSGEDNIVRLIERRVGPHLDEVKKILYS